MSPHVYSVENGMDIFSVYTSLQQYIWSKTSEMKHTHVIQEVE